MKFLDRLEAAQIRSNSTLAIGIAPALKKLPYEIQRYDDPFLPFGKAIIDSTADLVCGYVFHLGPYLALGAAGAKALERTIAYVPDHLVKILHGPFVSKELISSVFEGFAVDAVTLDGLRDSTLNDVMPDSEHGYVIRVPAEVSMFTGQKVSPEFQIGTYVEYEPYQRVCSWSARYPIAPDVFLPNPVSIEHLIDWHNDDIVYASQGDDFREAMRNVALKLRQPYRLEPRSD